MNVKEMSLPMPKNGKQMTEQEYIQTCNTEQLAKFLCNIYEMGKNGKQYFMRLDKCVEWLKQLHPPK